MKRLLVGILFITAAIGAFAQATAQEETYKFDFGGGLGMSGYLGDANESSMFKHASYAANLSMRYLANTRWAVRWMVGVASLKGNTADWTNVLPGGANYSFSSTVVDLNGRFEFNFFPYGIGETYKRLKRLTPYLAVGFGGAMSFSDGQTNFAPIIPMAFGVKYKIKERLNLGAEFCISKAFGDKMDSNQLTDLYEIKSSFLKNTDWYSSIQISLSYEFGKRCVTCHYVD